MKDREPMNASPTPEEVRIADLQARKDANAVELGKAAIRVRDGVIKIEDGTKLSVHCEVGGDIWTAVTCAKLDQDLSCQMRNVKSTWNDEKMSGEANYNALMHFHALEARRTHPQLLDANDTKKIAKGGKATGTESRMADWVLVSQSVKLLIGILPSCESYIMGLSYRTFANYISRTCVTLNKNALTCELKEEWIEFLRQTVPLIWSTDESKRLEIGQFLAAVDGHKAKLDQDKADARFAGKTPEQKADTLAKEEQRKATNKFLATRLGIQKSLQTAIIDGADEGYFKPSEVSDMILTAVGQCQTRIPLGKTMPSLESFTVANFQMFVDEMTSAHDPRIKDMAAILQTAMAKLDTPALAIAS